MSNRTWDRDAFIAAGTTEDPPPLRAWTERPFHAGGWRVATNGHILCAVPDPEGSEEGAVDDSVRLKVIERLTAQHPLILVTTTDALRAFAVAPPPQPEAAEGKCPDCSGDGQCECECGHIHDCHCCDGSGKVIRRPEPARFEPGWIADRLINRHLLHTIAEHLPAGDPVSLCGERGAERPLRFEGPDWRALLMPMRVQWLGEEFEPPPRFDALLATTGETI